MKPAPIGTYPFICRDCAEAQGGKPSEGVATMHHGTCLYCGKRRTLSHWNDWDWPDRGLTRRARETRD